LEEKDSKSCVVCGRVIRGQPPISVIVDMADSTITCFYHPKCFKTRAPNERLVDTYRVAAGFIAIIDEHVARSTPPPKVSVGTKLTA
jgi:hypothetical protein